MNQAQREQVTDAVVGSVVGFAGTGLCWWWFLGDWCRAGLQMLGVV